MKKITFLIVLIALCFSWNAVAQITSYPYSEDFESSDGGWVATNGSNGTWTWGTPTASVINSAASGTKAWATNLSGDYNANENSFVKSPVFDLSTLTAPSIEFSIWWNSEFSWDGTVLQSSIDNGATWQNVGAFNDPNNWFNDNTINGNPGGQQIGWTGRNSSNNGSNGWRIARHALTGLAGQSNVVFRFAFGSDGSVQDNGVAFDSLSIFEVSCPEPVNLMVNSIVDTDVNISWTPGGTQTEFEFLNLTQGSPAPTNADSGASISTNSVTVMNLIEGQSYQFYVRTVCGTDEFSSWGGPLNYAISGPGETCVNPLIVSTPLPYITSDDTANYFDDYDGTPGSACGSTYSYLNGDDVVYAYTPDADTSIDILLSNLSATYAGIFVYDSCANIGVSCLTGATNSFSQTDLFIDNFDVTAGQTYYIVISTWASPQSVAYTLTITENTCIDPVVTYNVVGDCQVAPQFYVEVNLTNLGSGDTITLTDNQGSAVQTATATGLFTFGPYANATNVVITTANADDANCTLTSPALTQPFCQDFVVDCSAGASTLNYCYDNGGANAPVIFTFSSNDGNSLNLTFNAGRVENGWDELVIIDTDGSFIVAPTDNFYGAAGNLAGLTYPSTGDTISFYINSDGSGSCQSSSTYTPIDVSVTCATCTNPAATYAVRGDCINGPQFFVDVDITSLGSANSLTVTDNQSSTPQTVTSTGLISFGPYVNATDVQITVANDDDVNCVRSSTLLTQPFCLENYVDCSAGPVNSVTCYGPNEGAGQAIVFYSTDGVSALNMVFNSGNVENGWDQLIVLDSDGVTNLNPLTPYGNAGNVAGLTFQSSGTSISFYVNSDGIISCNSSSTINPLNVSVTCATCINPIANYAVIDDCDNGQQFLIDVNITSIGDAESLTVTDNQGSAGVQVTATGIVQMGPYPFATPIIITVSNDQDVNCVINSQPIQVAACPPANDNCPGATVAAVNQGSTCDLTTPGTILAATPSGVPASSCGGNADDDVWFQFTALHGVELISLLNITGGTTNLDHAVYSGSCGALTEVYCTTENSSVSPLLNIGDTYYLRIFSAGSLPESTSFEVCIQQAPENTVCEQAANFCSTGSGSNVTGFPSLGSVACLYSTPNPSWNIIQIGDPGLVQIQISQTSDATGNGLDVDFVLWGPFTSDTDFCSLGLEVDCPSCPNNTSNPGFYPFGNIVDCSYDAATVENATIANAQTGEIYLLLVTNYSNQPGQITINQTNSGAGAGSTVAEIQVDLGGDQNTCGETSIVLTANSPFADTYEWYADGFVIDGETGPTLTVTETNTYTVIVYDAQCDAYAEDEVTITIGTAPIANPVSDMVACDLTGEGSVAFNLEGQTATIVGGQDPSLVTVTYHLSQSDADLGVGELSSPYTNISSPQTIYVRVEDANAADCFVTSSFDLIVSGTSPTATSADMTTCDDTTADGFASFDLTTNDVNILNGQSNTDYGVSYYATEDDANARIDALVSPYTNTSNPQTIWARVENVNATSCFAIVSFELIVNLNPTVNPAPDLAGCDTDDNDIAEFDFTTNETAINGGEPNVTFTYYTSLADATAPINSIGNPTDYETNMNTVFVRLDNDLTGCFSITSFNLVPGEVPMTSFPSNFNYEVCPNATTPIMITVTAQNYTEADVSIVWFRDGGVISGQTGLTLPVLVAGTYSIQVTFNETGCTSTVSQEVVVLDNCIIPQGISPDGDGKNDTFDLSAFNVTRIEIFNRLGTLVYSKDNYTNEWYGQTNKGDQLPVGTYFYTMIYEGGAKQRSAWVYINK